MRALFADCQRPRRIVLSRLPVSMKYAVAPPLRSEYGLKPNPWRPKWPTSAFQQFLNWAGDIFINLDDGLHFRRMWSKSAIMTGSWIATNSAAALRTEVFVNGSETQAAPAAEQISSQRSKSISPVRKQQWNPTSKETARRGKLANRAAMLKALRTRVSSGAARCGGSSLYQVFTNFLDPMS